MGALAVAVPSVLAVTLTSDQDAVVAMDEHEDRSKTQTLFVVETLSR